MYALQQKSHLGNCSSCAPSDAYRGEGVSEELRAFLPKLLRDAAERVPVLFPIPAHLFDPTASRLALINPPYHMGNRTSPLLRWRPATSCNSTFYLAPVTVEVPENFTHLKPQCDNRVWTRDYALYSGAVFVAQFLWLPVLGRPPIAAALGSDERQAARRAVADDAFLCVRLHVEA